MTMRRKNAKKALQQPLDGMAKKNKAQLKFDPEYPTGLINKRPVNIRFYDDAEREALKDSMNEFGVLEPIIIDEDSNVIHGELRLEVAKELGYTVVPVIITNALDKNKKLNLFYGLYANKMNDWSKWNAPVNDSILTDIDGEMKNVDIEGDNGVTVTVKDEHGKYRDMARKLGLFVNVIPKNLTASTANLKELALLREKSLGTKYQYDDAQLLFIESLRKEILNAREKLIAENKLDGFIVEKYEHHKADEKDIKKQGALVSRAAFLRNIGLSNEEISKRMGIPVNAAKSNGKIALDDKANVEACLHIADKAVVDPAGTYKYLMQDRIDAARKVDADETITSMTKAGASRQDIINRIIELTGCRQSDAEDYLDYRHYPKFHLNDLFSYLIKTHNARYGSTAERQLRITDFPLTKQAGGKACSLVEFMAITAFDMTFDPADKAHNAQLAEGFWNAATTNDLANKLNEMLSKYDTEPKQQTLFSK